MGTSSARTKCTAADTMYACATENSQRTSSSTSRSGTLRTTLKPVSIGNNSASNDKVPEENTMDAVRIRRPFHTIKLDERINAVLGPFHTCTILECARNVSASLVSINYQLKID